MALASHFKKNLVGITILGLLAAFTYKLSLPLLHQSLYQVLSLYSQNFFQGAIWTLFTYPFMIPFTHSLTVYDVYQFAFDLALIAFLGHQILKKIKPSHFYLFFYGSSLFVGIVMVLLSYFFSFTFELTGLRPMFFALLMTWTELYNTNNFLFSRNVSTRTITLATIGFTILIDLANASWIDLGSILLSLGYAYCLAKILALKPFLTVNRVILEDAYGNPIEREKPSAKVHSIYQGRQLDRFYRLLRDMKRKINNLFFKLK